MKELEVVTTSGMPISEIFIGRSILKSIAEEKPRRGGVTLEFADASSVYIWFEVIELDGWEVTGALRVIENSADAKPVGICTKICQPNGMEISSVSGLYVNVRADGVKHKVVNGLILADLNGNSITIVSSPMAGAMDFAMNAELDALDMEYTIDAYRILPFGTDKSDS